VDDATHDDEDDRRLPALEKGDRVKLLSIKPEQHFTEPPPRFSEASLVKALEEYGIGRPSTYASIIQTLLFKKYCELVSRRFVPTDLGKIVNRFLTGNFERYVDFGFTAAMEDELDNISRGEEEWVPVLDRFWSGLKKQIDDVEENVTRSDVAMARDIGVDPVSGRPVSVRYGKYGAFAQIGTRDDTDKPKFASLRPGQHMDGLTLEQALELFKLPRTLGTMPDGQPIRVAVGRFGPYAQFGTKSYVSLKAEDDPYTVTLERALALIQEKQQIEANRVIREFPAAGVQVLNGRYGPYITDGKKNGKIPKDRDPKSLTLEECQALIAAAPERKGRWAKKSAPVKTAKARTKAKAATESDAVGPAPKKKAPAKKKKTKAKSAEKKA
jgi:DNA topoisomerase-1